MNDLTVILAIMGIIAALLQGLILLLLTLIFNAINKLRDTFKEYVTLRECCEKREENSRRLGKLEKKFEELTK